MPSNETLKPRPQNNNSDRTPFVIAFNPALSNVASAVRKNFNMLKASGRCKRIIQSAAIVAYLLVRSQLRDHKVKLPPGSGIHKCHHPRCLTCPLLQDGQLKYTSSATKEVDCSQPLYNLRTRKKMRVRSTRRCGMGYASEASKKNIFLDPHPLPR